jgi:hypothetical protein
MFTCNADGPDPAKAFDAAKEAAYWYDGHAGYTGTIAEKDSYVVITDGPIPEHEADELAERVMAADDERISDKWGPAGAIAIGQDGNTTGWLFFGWASS